MDPNTTPKTQYTYLAVDIGKEMLQLQSPNSASKALTYDDKGLKLILQQARRQRNETGLPPLVIFEATGGYEKRMLHYLEDHKVAYCLINPSRVRHHAASKGIKAKTDKIDGEVLLDFAQANNIQATAATDPDQVAMAALLDQRNHLTSAIAKEQTRLKNSDSTMHPSIQRTIDFLTEEQQCVEKQIRVHIEANSNMTRIEETIKTIKGLGEITAWAIIAYFPEITKMTRNQANAMAGLAPYNDDSATKEGKRCIRAGRSKLRKSLYMPALVATRYNPHIKKYYQRLIEKGKPYKCAIVAVMRKIILHIRSKLISSENGEILSENELA